MPNWCEGNIRFRGACKNVKALLDNELKCTATDARKHVIVTSNPIVTGEDYMLTVAFPGGDNEGNLLWPAFYINGTRRNFIDGRYAEAIGEYDIEDERQVKIFVFDGFKAAWGIEPEPYKALSKKYEVDIHIFGWECGMEFSQEVEIIRGELTRNTETTYGDWGWDSPMPHLGG